MNLKQSTKIFKALANERISKILEYLSQEENLSVGAISEKISLSFKSTSKHLLILENAGLVFRRQNNLNVFYWLNREKLRELIEFLKSSL